MPACVTMIIPVYNTEKYLPRLIESLENQTFQNFDCVFVNDGSTDQSENIIRAYHDLKTRKVQYICQNNMGAAAARNAGLKVAEGLYYGFLDSDDYIMPEYMEKMVDALERTSADVAIMGVKVIKNGTESKKDCEVAKEESVLCAVEYAKKVLGKEDASYIVANKIIRNRKSNVLFPDGLMFEDMYYASALAWRNNKVVFIPELLYVYCMNADSVSHIVDKKQIFDFIAVCHLVTEGYIDAGMKEELKADLEKYLSTAAGRIDRKCKELPKGLIRDEEMKLAEEEMSSLMRMVIEDD